MMKLGTMSLNVRNTTAYVRTKFYQIHSGVEEWLNYPLSLDILQGVGYNGCLSIVYEGESNRVEAMQKARKYLESIL